jgi:hypothetical protein
MMGGGAIHLHGMKGLQSMANTLLTNWKPMLWMHLAVTALYFPSHFSNHIWRRSNLQTGFRKE